MGTIVRLVAPPPARAGGDDTLWAVVATAGRKSIIADIHPSRAAALTDLGWREQIVRAYSGMLKRTGQPVPRYSLRTLRRADLPRAWRPLPALGFLGNPFG